MSTRSDRFGWRSWDAPRSSRTGQIERNAALTLLRRTKQGVAEWYVLEMLEKSRNGIEIHTDQGFNVGKPCYGYQAEKVKHPVSARRAQGRYKTRLEPDPTRSATVAKIFDLRLNGGLSYRAICGVLNEDLHAWPPPQPVDPTRAAGHWIPGAIREILVNPKYTGYMVWNRRATKDKQHPGRQNPKDQWVISSKPEHPALISVETFLATQELTGVRTAQPGREKHRADRDPATPNSHPQTRHVYRLRSYVWCVPCQRRMHGHSTRHGTAYSYCQPRNRVIPDGHPPAVRVREDALIAGATWFFNHHVLGPDRVALAKASLPAAADFVRAQYQKAEERIRRKIQELGQAMDNLVRVLERAPDPEGLLFARTSGRIGELERELGRLEAQLRAHQAAAPPELDENPGLLAWLPRTEIDLTRLATARLRRFLDAFRVEIHYDVRTGRAMFRATISAELVNQSAQQIHRIEIEEPCASAAGSGPVTPSGRENAAQISEGSSFRMCPRQGTQSIPPCDGWWRCRRRVIGTRG